MVYLEIALLLSSVALYHILYDTSVLDKCWNYIKHKFTPDTSDSLNSQKIVTNYNTSIKEFEIKILPRSCNNDSEKWSFALLYTTNLYSGLKDHTLILEPYDNYSEDYFNRKIKFNFSNKNVDIDGVEVTVDDIKYGTINLYQNNLDFKEAIIRTSPKPWTPKNFDIYRDELEKMQPLIDLDETDNLPQFSFNNTFNFKTLKGQFGEKIIASLNNFNSNFINKD